MYPHGTLLSLFLPSCIQVIHRLRWYFQISVLHATPSPQRYSTLAYQPRLVARQIWCACRCFVSGNIKGTCASYQIRNITGCACAGKAGTVSPHPRVSDPDMHHGTCVTHVPWCMPGPLTGSFLWNRWWGKLLCIGSSSSSRRMHVRAW